MTSLIDKWNYNETWLLARCPKEVADLESKLFAVSSEEDLQSSLNQLLQKAEELEPTVAGLKASFADIWLSLEVFVNDQEVAAYLDMIDDPASYDDLEEFLLYLIDNYQPIDLIGTRFYDEKGF